METKRIAFYQDETGEEVHYINCYFGGGYFDSTKKLTVDLEVYMLKHGGKFTNEYGKPATVLIKFDVVEYRDNKNRNNTCIIKQLNIKG